jgi:hypothetical protein
MAVVRTTWLGHNNKSDVILPRGWSAGLPACLAGGCSPIVARIFSRTLLLYIMAIKDTLSPVATHGYLY